MAPPKPASKGQVTLTQMLKALDKDVAGSLERRLKKLSKKKAIKVPLDKNKADQLERRAAYSATSKELTKWDPIVDKNKRANHIKFPLDQEPEILPTTSESLSEIKPQNELEREVTSVIGTSASALHDNQELSKAEQSYLKAISAEEAQERHKELQRMRVLLSSYAAKMRRQKAIKSKSYRRLLKHERIRSHVKKVESDKDLLIEEIERLQRLRAKERASLKHKNTGKWAKHAKFRSKYDDEARKAMLEQIGLAEKLLEKPAAPNSDSDEEDDDDDDVIEEDDDQDSSDNQGDDDMATTNENKVVVRQDGSKKDDIGAAISDRLIVSSELLKEKSLRKRRDSEDGEEGDNDDGGEEVVMGSDDDNGEDADEQRKLMSEAFANDDVVAQFQRAKDQLADEEQPKDVDLYLPGWGGWAGPGIKVNKKKRNKYIIKAKKLPRKDDNLGNVIISEQADSKMNSFMVKKLPRGVKNEKKFGQILTKPTAATFVGQAQHRESIKPRIATKMGARIEPMSKRVLQKGNKAKWA